MKKLVIVFLAVFIVAPSVWAEHQEISSQKEEDRVSTLILIQNDWIKTEGQKSLQSQRGIAYWQKGKFGGGIDIIATPDTDTSLVKPFGTVKIFGPVSFVGGVMTTSFDSDYVLGGVWIFQKISSWKTFWDIKEFTEISGKKSDFLDVFLEVTRPVFSEKFSLGAVGMYDHWWADDNHDWFFIGPIAYYHFTKEFAIFLRPSCEWERNDGKTTRTKKGRFGVKINF